MSISTQLYSVLVVPRIIHGPRYIAWEQTTKRTPPLRFLYCWDDVTTRTDRKENTAALLLHCMATAVNKRLAVDCWTPACTSQYVCHRGYMSSIWCQVSEFTLLNLIIRPLDLLVTLPLNHQNSTACTFS
jgi:hypothetical protein